MKEKFKSVGDWFKEKFKSKKKHTIEGIYEFITQEFNYDRMNLERANTKVERQLEDNLELAKQLSLKEEEIKELNKKLDNLQVHFDKLVEITKSSNKEFAEGLAKINEGTLVIEKLPEDKAKGNQKATIKSSSRNSRIIKAVTK